MRRRTRHALPGRRAVRLHERRGRTSRFPCGSTPRSLPSEVAAIVAEKLTMVGPARDPAQDAVGALGRHAQARGPGPLDRPRPGHHPLRRAHDRPRPAFLREDRPAHRRPQRAAPDDVGRRHARHRRRPHGRRPASPSCTRDGSSSSGPSTRPPAAATPCSWSTSAPWASRAEPASSRPSPRRKERDRGRRTTGRPALPRRPRGPHRPRGDDDRGLHGRPAGQPLPQEVPLLDALRVGRGPRPGNNVVTLNGVVVGNVIEVNLSGDPADRTVRVVYDVVRRWAPMLRKGTRASIKTRGLLGDKYIELEGGQRRRARGADRRRDPGGARRRPREAPRGQRRPADRPRRDRQVAQGHPRAHREGRGFPRRDDLVQPRERANSATASTTRSTRSTRSSRRSTAARASPDKLLIDEKYGRETSESLAGRHPVGPVAAGEDRRGRPDRQRRDPGAALGPRGQEEDLRARRRPRDRGRGARRRRREPGAAATGRSRSSCTTRSSARSSPKNLQSFTLHLDSICRKLDEGEGTAGKLINDPALFDAAQPARRRRRRVGDPALAHQGPPEGGIKKEYNDAVNARAPPSTPMPTPSAVMRSSSRAVRASSARTSRIVCWRAATGSSCSTTSTTSTIPRSSASNVAPHLGHPRYRLVEGDIRDRALVFRLFAEERFDAVRAPRGARRRAALPDPGRPLRGGQLRRDPSPPRGGGRPRQAPLRLRLLLVGLRRQLQAPLLRRGPDRAAGLPVRRRPSARASSTSSPRTTSTACRRVALRFFTVYGPRQRPEMAIARFIRGLESGRAHPLLRRRDLAARLHVHRRHRRRDRGGARAPDFGFEIVNLGGARPVTLAELVAALEARDRPEGPARAPAGSAGRRARDVRRDRKGRAAARVPGAGAARGGIAAVGRVASEPGGAAVSSQQ